MGLAMDVAGYRAKAAELRRCARTAADPVAFEELLRVATEYDRLAERAQAGAEEEKW